MRFRPVILLIAFLSLLAASSTPSSGKDDARHAQIQAAHADAVAGLVDQVRVARLTPELTVGQFLDQTAGTDQLRRAVERNAELIGATRWPNPGTCQVQLEVPGDALVQALAAIARDGAGKSPLPPEAVEKRLADLWRHRGLAATGTSATPEAVERMRPGPEHPLWLTVPEEDRREAVKAAQRNAARRTMDGLSDITVAGGRSLANALEVPAVRDAVQNWVATRPVTNIEFRDNGEVRLTVAAPGEDLWVVLRDALARQNEIPAPRDEAEWQRLHDQVVGRMRSPLNGRSAVATERATTGPRPAARTALPQEPPRWADDQWNVEGRSAGDGPPLRVAHSAEVDARKELRRRVEALPLGDGRTLGQAAGEDPEVAAAIERTLLRARANKVDWGVHGQGATVHVGLDLRLLWQELSRR